MDKSIIVCGDIHGYWRYLNILINKKRPKLVLQTGDWGWWPKIQSKPFVKNGVRYSGFNSFGVKAGKTKIIFAPGNHECVSKNTEVLTEDGWRYIAEIIENNELINVAQFDIGTGEISFALPEEYIKTYAKELIVFDGNNTFQEVTPKHDVIINNKKVKAETLVGAPLKEKSFRLFGNYNSTVNISNAMIRLLTWVVADATMVDYTKYNKNSIKKVIQFKLSKQRKISALTAHLTDMGIPFTFKPAKKSGVNKLQPYYIRIYGDAARMIFSELNNKKELPSNWRFFNREQLGVFLETLVITDGSILAPQETSIGMLFNTTNILDANVIQQACITNNVMCKISPIGKGNIGKVHLEQYRCRIHTYTEFFNAPNINVSKILYEDYAYCFKMPLGTIITRNKGRVSFTGNCWNSLDLWNDLELPELMPNVFYAKRGTTYTLPDGRVVLFMGGAASIDKAARTPGVDWFPQEVLTLSELYKLEERKLDRIDIVISHTCPQEFNESLKLKQPYGGWEHKFRDTSQEVLSELLYWYKPSLWYFGHFHIHMEGLFKETGTKWVCLNETSNTNWWKYLDN